MRAETTSPGHRLNAVRVLNHQLSNGLPAEPRVLLQTAAGAAGELAVVQPQQVQPRDMHVAGGVDVLGGGA